MDDSANAVDALLSQWEEVEVPQENEDALDEPSEDLAEEELDSEELEAEDIVEDEDEAEDEQEETPDDESEETDEDEEDNNEGEDEDPQAPQTVTVKVNGEEKEVSVDELTRLYGQEAALTQKSQKVAEERKQLEETEKTYEATLERLMENSKADYEQYANIDWMVAQKQLSDEEFSVLRSEAMKAQKAYQSVTQDVGVYLKDKQANLEAQLKTKTEKTHEVMTEANIGWSQAKYKEMVSFAISKGMSEEQAASMVDAPLFLIIHQAMQAETAKNVVAKKKSKTPQKVLRSKEKPKVNQGEESLKKASARLNKTGSEEDAVALLLKQWQ